MTRALWLLLLAAPPIIEMEKFIATLTKTHQEALAKWKAEGSEP